VQRLLCTNQAVRAESGDCRSERMSGVLGEKQGGRECATDGRREA
jgi:hypothetical protein